MPTLAQRVKPHLLAFFGILGAALAAEPSTFERRLITHPDLWLMKRVGEPVPSPDGRFVVFLVASASYESKDQSIELWICPADASALPRQITHIRGPITGPAWSRDSRRVAFSSRMEGDETPEIYVLDLAQGGDAERVTQVPNGARAPLWSPDGSSLLFVSDVAPPDAPRSKADMRVYDSFPVRHWDHWLDDRRPHLFVGRVDGSQAPHDLFAHSKFAAGPGYALRQTDSGDHVDAAWAPDGRSVIFAATTEIDRTAYAFAPAQLFSVSLSGGEPVALTRGEDAYSFPSFRPDGKALLARVEKGGDGKIYHVDRLAEFPWPMGFAGRRILTQRLDLAVVRFAASPDSSTIYFTAETAGHEKLFSVPAAGGDVYAYDLPRSGCLSGLAMGGDALVADFESASAPPELVRIYPESVAFRPLTEFNAAKLATLDLPSLESFSFTSAQGRTIQNFLMRPARFDPAVKYPLVVIMHGGPASMARDAWSIRWNYALLSEPGYVLLMTNYTGSTGFGEAFSQAIQRDPLKTPADEINQAADEAIRRYPFIDAARQAAAGASYGGHLANWLEATTTRYRCLVSHAGLVNLESQWGTSDGIYDRELTNGGPIWERGPVWTEQNPVRYAGNHFKGTGWVTPMLLSAGEKDARVPINNALENWSYLQRLQVPSRLLVFPEETHWILRGEDSRAWYGEVRDWFARWLK